MYLGLEYKYTMLKFLLNRFLDPRILITGHHWRRWTATASRWSKEEVDHGSWLTYEILRTVVETSRLCSLLTTQAGCIDGDRNEVKPAHVLNPESWYIWYLFSSAPVATELACMLLACTSGCAHVFGQLASQARQRPLFNLICVSASGLLSLRPHSVIEVVFVHGCRTPAELSVEHTEQYFIHLIMTRMLSRAVATCRIGLVQDVHWLQP